MKNGQTLKVVIISDGTGETAAALSKATMTQFPDQKFFSTRYKSSLRRTSKINFDRSKFTS